MSFGRGVGSAKNRDRRKASLLGKGGSETEVKNTEGKKSRGQEIVEKPHQMGGGTLYTTRPKKSKEKDIGRRRRGRPGRAF